MDLCVQAITYHNKIIRISEDGDSIEEEENLIKYEDGLEEEGE